MKYQANPVIVDAFKITTISDLREDGSVRIELEDGAVKRASAEMLARFMPGVGDYWVVQEDDYVYLNPREVFERKYRRQWSPTEPIPLPVYAETQKRIGYGSISLVAEDGCAVVKIEHEGREIEVIRERVGAPFSHNVSSIGIEAAIKRQEPA